MAETGQQEFNTLSDTQLLGVDESFDQESLLGLTKDEQTPGGKTVVNLSNFALLEEAAAETGNRWTARISYEMASWTETGTTAPAAQGSSTMGGLLKTSISLQEGNMEFQITKGIVDAAASKAASTAGDIGRSAKGQ